MRRFTSIFHPHRLLTFLLVLISTISLFFIFLYERQEEPYVYLIYTLSTYSLLAVCTYIPTLCSLVSTRIHRNSFSHRYMSDMVFRAKVSLNFSLVFNCIYTLGKLGAGLYFSSLWMCSIALYYLVLVAARFSLFRYMKKSSDPIQLHEEYIRYRRTAYMLGSMTMILFVMIIQMIWQKQTYRYPGTLIYVAATYAFYCVGISIKNIIQYRKLHRPILSAAKAINFTSALVSIFALQTAMLTQFGNDTSYAFWMNACSGTGIIIILFASSMYMIIHANHALTDHVSKHT